MGMGLAPGDHKYKMLKKVSEINFSQWLFGFWHPRTGMIGHYFSRKSRAATGQNDEHFLGEEKEWLIIYSKERLQKESLRLFYIGHRHLLRLILN